MTDKNATLLDTNKKGVIIYVLFREFSAYIIQLFHSDKTHHPDKKTVINQLNTLKVWFLNFGKPPEDKRLKICPKHGAYVGRCLRCEKIKQ